MLAAIAQVEKDSKLNSDFEAMVAYVLPSDPVANKKTNNVNSKASISDIDASASTTAASGRGLKTKVDLRHYKTNEYLLLTKPQRNELREWKLAHPEEFKKSWKLANKGARSNKRRKTNSDVASQISSAVQKETQKELKKLKDELKPNGNDSESDKASSWFASELEKHKKKSKGNVSFLDGAVEMMKNDVHSAPHAIRKAIDNFETSRKSDE